MGYVLGVTAVSVVVGMLISIPAMAVGFWLQGTAKGPNRFRASMLTCILLVLLWQVLAKGLPFCLLPVIAVLVSTLGVYRTEIYRAAQRAQQDASARDQEKNQ